MNSKDQIEVRHATDEEDIAWFKKKLKDNRAEVDKLVAIHGSLDNVPKEDMLVFSCREKEIQERISKLMVRMSREGGQK